MTRQGTSNHKCVICELFCTEHFYDKRAAAQYTKTNQERLEEAAKTANTFKFVPTEKENRPKLSLLERVGRCVRKIISWLI